jgi:hypothetical protein
LPHVVRIAILCAKWFTSDLITTNRNGSYLAPFDWHVFVGTWRSENGCSYIWTALTNALVVFFICYSVINISSNEKSVTVSPKAKFSESLSVSEVSMSQTISSSATEIRLFIRRYVNHTVANKKHNQRISQSHYHTRTFPAHIPLFIRIVGDTCFSHFKAIYQFPKHIIAWIKIVANASLIYPRHI